MTKYVYVICKITHPVPNMGKIHILHIVPIVRRAHFIGNQKGTIDLTTSIIKTQLSLMIDVMIIMDFIM